MNLIMEKPAANNRIFKLDICQSRVQLSVEIAAQLES